MSRALAFVFALQAAVAVSGLLRLTRWRRRPSPVEPVLRDPAQSEAHRRVLSIVVPTLNEAHRLPPLLAALQRQGDSVLEIIVVDSHSTDGTAELVHEAARHDARIRLMTDDPLPPRWIGKAWALECARRQAAGTWILGLDADTVPHASLADAVVAAVQRDGWDAVSFSPRFAGQSALERWLQPSILATLIYRFGPGGRATPPGRVLANGQCFLVRRAVLAAHGGYSPVRASFAEDVSLARHLALEGARVGFLDGSKLYDVRSYTSARQMWREWGRSIDLKDATTRAGQAGDVALIVALQGMPLPVLLCAAFGAVSLLSPVLAVNAVLFLARVLLGIALRRSYAERGVSYWLSPLSDPLAALRIVLSSLRRPAAWRGRLYAAERHAEA